MKVFISQPMTGLSKEEILERRQEVKLRLFLELGDYNIEYIQTRLCLLGNPLRRWQKLT